jgi:hypothetical protein
LSLVLVTLLAQVPVTLAQEPATREWSAVQALSSGDELVIETRNGETVKGRLNSVSDAQLSLSHKNNNTNIDRNNIRRIYRLGGTSRGKSALIGAGIGGGVGTAAGVAVYSQGDFIGAVIPLFGAIGAGIGAAIGAAFGGKRERVLIYEAR